MPTTVSLTRIVKRIADAATKKDKASWDFADGIASYVNEHPGQGNSETFSDLRIALMNDHGISYALNTLMYYNDIAQAFPASCPTRRIKAPESLRIHRAVWQHVTRIVKRDEKVTLDQRFATVKRISAPYIRKALKEGLGTVEINTIIDEEIGGDMAPAKDAVIKSLGRWLDKNYWTLNARDRRAIRIAFERLTSSKQSSD